MPYKQGWETFVTILAESADALASVIKEYTIIKL